MFVGDEGLVLHSLSANCVYFKPKWRNKIAGAIVIKLTTTLLYLRLFSY